jgi:hypothetical protein
VDRDISHLDAGNLFLVVISLLSSWDFDLCVHRLVPETRMAGGSRWAAGFRLDWNSKMGGR